MQLAAYAQNQFALGHDAMLVNEGLVLYVVNEIRRNFDLEELTIGLMGMAFKANVDDTRSSLSYKMRKMLSLYAKRVITTDPFVTTDPTLLPLAQVVSESDVLVLCTPHAAYEKLDLKGKPVFDVWGMCPGSVM